MEHRELAIYLNDNYRYRKLNSVITNDIDNIIKDNKLSDITVTINCNEALIFDIKIEFREEEIEIPNKEKKTEVDDPELLDYLEERDPNDLTYEDMIHIIKLYDSGYYFQKDIARFFNISAQKTHRIINNKMKLYNDKKTTK